MRFNRKLATIAATIAVLAVAGAGIAYAVGGGSEEQVTGPAAEKAKRAALDSLGGGDVLEIERSDGAGDGAYEVEVQRPDGSQAEVHVSAAYETVGTVADDDQGEGSADDAGEDGD
jgi:uncharacterized membrane protein YkoI